jgi:ribosomal 50S subunit-associated protein YjgA (DUF615 family)
MMIENKQTAVEWLIEQWPILESQLTPQLIKQAKAMEEENTINFSLQHIFGTTEVGINLKNEYVKKYNDTFKSE